jgi:hypothetical protein
MYLLQAAEKEPWDTVLRGTVKACCQNVINEIDLASTSEHAVENWVNGVARVLKGTVKACCRKVLDEIDVDSTCEHTDENWVNGVARSWATAFFVANSIHARSELTVGKTITFSDGTTRTIVSTKEDGESLIIFLEGVPLDGTVVGYPKKFIVHSGIK